MTSGELEEIDRRKTRSHERMQSLSEHLNYSRKEMNLKACIYATGSYGRKEAGEKSDLDLFIVGHNNGVKREDGIEGSLLSRLSEICVKAEVIHAAKKLSIAHF